MSDAHYFVFSREFVDGHRICGGCGSNYDDGNHLLIDKLKPRTSYVCPTGGGYGHSSISTGAYAPVQRTLRDHLCSCGAEFVEEDNEVWRISFETQTPLDPEWHPVTRLDSKHAVHQQGDGLLELIDQGEPIRNVVIEQVSA